MSRDNGREKEDMIFSRMADLFDNRIPRQKTLPKFKHKKKKGDPVWEHDDSLFACLGLTKVGPQGKRGLKGDIGPTGLPGIDGKIGYTGPCGPIGYPGPCGKDGVIGPCGKDGVTGPCGKDGVTGPIGMTGPCGQDGQMGYTGPCGVTGPMGYGATGLMGPTGPMGLRGRSGESGKSGYDAVVNYDGEGDYTSIAEAFNAGEINVTVARGIYQETQDIRIPSGGSLYGVSPGAVIIDFGNSASSIIIDGSSRQESDGKVTVFNDSKAVKGIGTRFTNLQVSDYIKLGTSYYRIGGIINDTNLVLRFKYKGVSLINIEFVAQSMIMGCKISNIIVTNTASEGIKFNQCIGVSIREVLMEYCGDVTHPNLNIKCSAELSIIGLIVSASKNKGILIDSSSLISITTTLIKDCDGHGIYNKNSTDIIIDDSMVNQNNGNGIHIDETSSRINITDTILSQNKLSGMSSIFGSELIAISNCTCSGNGELGVNFLGINNMVENSVIKDNLLDGVLVGDSGSISNNNIVGNNKSGINSDNCNHCTITGNIIYNNLMYGVDCGLSNIISGNRIYNNMNGIIVKNNRNEVIISGNNLSDNGDTGIDIYSDDVVLTTNISFRHKYGIHIQSTANDTIVTSNNLKNNTINALLNSGVDTVSSSNKL